MTTAREIMTPGAEHVSVDDTVAEVARRLEQEDVGALPVCRDDGHLFGMVTDRDLVVRVMAAGLDPETTTVGSLADQPEVATIGADDSVEEALRTMTDHAVRRLPVIDGTELVGMVSQADVARACPPDQVGRLVEAISAAP
ncbi:MAG TPA: CBS domain-containing protein [Iamia sp.]|jgi:CBS domain-containing protein|nr:CBS domain-containing protein [Iamia sp.]